MVTRMSCRLGGRVSSSANPAAQFTPGPGVPASCTGVRTLWRSAYSAVYMPSLLPDVEAVPDREIVPDWESMAALAGFGPNQARIRRGRKAGCHLRRRRRGCTPLGQIGAGWSRTLASHGGWTAASRATRRVRPTSEPVPYRAREDRPHWPNYPEKPIPEPEENPTVTTGKGVVIEWAGGTVLAAFEHGKGEALSIIDDSAATYEEVESWINRYALWGRGVSYGERVQGYLDSLPREPRCRDSQIEAGFPLSGCVS